MRCRITGRLLRALAALSEARRDLICWLDRLDIRSYSDRPLLDKPTAINAEEMDSGRLPSPRYGKPDFWARHCTRRITRDLLELKVEDYEVARFGRLAAS